MPFPFKPRAVESTNTTANAIAPELLHRGNYDRWSICIESYLISEDLWDGIIVPYSTDHQQLNATELRRKNAACLHAIQVSCGPEKFDQIKEIRLAKEVWNKLAQLHEEDHKGEDDDSKYKSERDQSIVPGLPGPSLSLGLKLLNL